MAIWRAAVLSCFALPVTGWFMVRRVVGGRRNDFIGASFCDHVGNVQAVFRAVQCDGNSASALWAACLIPGGLSGLGQVLAALNEARVEILLVGPGMAAAGVCDPDTGLLYATPEEVPDGATATSRTVGL